MGNGPTIDRLATGIDPVVQMLRICLMSVTSFDFDFEPKQMGEQANYLALNKEKTEKDEKNGNKSKKEGKNKNNRNVRTSLQGRFSFSVCGVNITRFCCRRHLGSFSRHLSSTCGVILTKMYINWCDVNKYNLAFQPTFKILITILTYNTYNNNWWN